MKESVCYVVVVGGKMRVGVLDQSAIHERQHMRQLRISSSERTRKVTRLLILLLASTAANHTMHQHTPFFSLPLLHQCMPPIPASRPSPTPPRTPSLHSQFTPLGPTRLLPLTLSFLFFPLLLLAPTNLRPTRTRLSRLARLCGIVLDAG